MKSNKELGMNFFSVFFCCFCVFLVSSHNKEANAAQEESYGIYIVYTGAASQKSDRDLLLSSSITREENLVIRTYNNGFSGFAARLSDEQAKSIAKKPGVISVFRDPILQLHTTRSWDFLYQTEKEMGLSPRSNSSSFGEDTIIGILDTGIWPESRSFNDENMGPIPSKWKGVCMAGHDFHTSNCNRKLIGARYYAGESSRITDRSPRDLHGHGTHVAAIAVGSPIERASYNGIAQGTAKGGSPKSRISIYRVCDENGCGGSNILKAFDDAIADGVDVISISIGSSFDDADFQNDVIAIGAFHAVEKGILVVCSAGNSQGEKGSVVNVAPWILTVAATSIDRDFESNVVLGGNKVIKGGAINLSNIGKSPVYPLILGGSAINNSSIDGEARACEPNSLDGNKVKGKIVACENYDSEEYFPTEKLEGITSLGGVGMILLDGNERNEPSIYSSPMTAVDVKGGQAILSYINSTRNPVATILPTTTVPGHRPAPSVALFSGRGPTYKTINILKPDIAAPGVCILSAWRGNNTDKGKTSHFNILSGTSMACPHVSAIAAMVKSKNPSWSPSAIKSAIMTTAIQKNNIKEPIKNNDDSPSTPYELGAGQVSPSGPLQPGLVYDMGNTDYLQFLCNNGYNISTIKLISSSVPNTFSCLHNSNIDLVSNMNYPSITLSLTYLRDKKIVEVIRTVTNVGEDESVYTAILDTPNEFVAQVTPKKLKFTRSKRKLSYTLKFRLTEHYSGGGMFGSITWISGKYKVRSPLVVD